MARMKCPNCGFTNERTETRCLRCGSGLVEHAELEATPVSVSSSASLPDWRKEVTRKAREFGERKKVLTTPPRPLKNNTNEPHVEPREAKRVNFQELDKDEPVFIEPPPLPPPLPPPPPPAVVTPNEEISTFTPPAPVHEPVIPVIIQERRQQPRLELDLSEVVPLIEDEQDLPLHLGRRAASLIVDHAIIGVVIFVIAFLCREIFNYDLQTINQSPVPFISGILLFHFLYYFYFWKTSRQTPGQVFFSLEVKIALSRSISAGRIFTRWASLVFLNVFNIVPLFFGNKFLLMDHLSGTIVRSMKPED